MGSGTSGPNWRHASLGIVPVTGLPTPSEVNHVPDAYRHSGLTGSSSARGLRSLQMAQLTVDGVMGPLPSTYNAANSKVPMGGASAGPPSVPTRTARIWGAVTSDTVSSRFGLQAGARARTRTT